MIPRLVAITPGDGRDLEPWLRALSAAGLRGLLLREPTGAAEPLYELATQWIPWVCVHLKTPGADTLPPGVARHLPAAASPSEWRSRVTGPLGQSTHDASSLDRAFLGGADYAFLSPVRTPSSKPGDTRATLGLERAGALAAGRTVLGLGGLDPEDLEPARQTGLHGIALIGGLFGAPSPELAAQRLEALRR